MSFWTYANLADVTQGRWLVGPDDLGDAVSGLWHDTREIKAGQAYLAIAGDNFDGHNFLDKAFDAGAACAVVSKEVESSKPTLLVDDTVKALQDLARAYRDALKQGGCRVIGIAGSNGKTTTRHLIHQVLTHAGLTGTQSPKSFNNHLGVPLTLLSSKPEDDFVAAEIGTNHPGEIDFLSAIARPDIAVVTSIGEEHLEFFKDLDGVTKEELSIANHFDDQTRCVIGDTVPWHDTALEPAVLRAEPWAYAAKDIRREIDPTHPPTRECAHLAAWVALVIGVEFDDAMKAMKVATMPPGRWQKLAMGSDVLVINDAYNANPTSLHFAVDALCDQPGKRHIFVLGEMYELGAASKNAHATAGQYPCILPIDMMIAIGQMTRDAYDVAKQEKPCHFFESWSDDLPEQIAALLEPGDTVLLKASRGMALERLIPAIEQRFGAATNDEPT